MTHTGVFKGNLEKLTLNNKFYRKVINTNKYQQLVLMSLPPLVEIGNEVHKHTSQFFRIESGHGVARVGDETFRLTDGSALMVPPGVFHNIMNTSKDSELKIYTIYSPPHHPIDAREAHPPETRQK